MTLDELLLEWSYRSEKGYPSLDNPSDVSILKSLLEKLNLPSNEVLNNLKEMPSYLSPKELEKYKDDPNKSRISVLIRKIENDEPLELFDGGTIIVTNKDEVINALEAGNIEKSIPLTGTNGESSNTSKLRKTTEFGGQDKVSTDISNLKVRTDVKESLVILICNVLSEGGTLNPFNPDSFNNNMDVIKSSSNKFANIEGDVQGYMEILFNLMKTYLEFPTKSKRKAESIFNNPYSIAVEILKAYSNPIFNRGSIFNKIRTECSKITGLGKDKWNPGDIYIINSQPTLPTDTDSIVPWNELFVNEWGSTDAPLVSISLKEEKYQPGRAKSYLEEFDAENLKTYDLNKEEKQWDKEKYKQEITKLRTSSEALLENGGAGSPNKIIKVGDGWEGKFPEDIKKLQGTYGAYKLLEFVLKTPKASILGIFAFGESIPGIPSANPTFFQMVGMNNGKGLKANNLYKGGSNTDMPEDEPITITDNSSSANITIKGKLAIVKDGEIYRIQDVSKTFRGDFGGTIGIV